MPLAPNALRRSAASVLLVTLALLSGCALPPPAPPADPDAAWRQEIGWGPAPASPASAPAARR